MRVSRVKTLIQSLKKGALTPTPQRLQISLEVRKRLLTEGGADLRGSLLCKRRDSQTRDSPQLRARAIDRESNANTPDGTMTHIIPGQRGEPSK